MTIRAHHLIQHSINPEQLKKDALAKDSRRLRDVYGLQRKINNILVYAGARKGDEVRFILSGRQYFIRVTNTEAVVDSIKSSWFTPTVPADSLIKDENIQRLIGVIKYLEDVVR